MNVDEVIAFEEGTMDEEKERQFMQGMINSGAAWKMNGSYGRAATAMIEAGACALGVVGHRDYWGNYVPGRDEVKPGTKGSVAYCESRGYTVVDPK